MSYFDPASDEEFRKKYPLGYTLLVFLGIAALLIPVIIFIIVAHTINPEPDGWIMVGWIGAFIIGIGFFNFVAIIINQYLGHLVSIGAFLIGGILVATSLNHL